MSKLVKRRLSLSYHQWYLAFAARAVRLSKSSAKTLTYDFYRQYEIDAVLYSYLCLEAAVEYVYHCGSNGLLPFIPKSTWLTRFLDRNWSSLSIAERPAILSYAWTGKAFWRNEEEFQLFCDLKKVRNALVHSAPSITEWKIRPIEERVLPGGTRYSRSTLAEPLRHTTKSRWTSQNAIAHFADSPITLTADDAEQAFEILLHHLLRIARIFFRNRNSNFCILDETNRYLELRVLLKSTKQRFSTIWKKPTRAVKKTSPHRA